MTAEKNSLRHKARARRALLARSVPDFARQAARSIGFLALAHGATVAGYVPIKDEADPGEIVKRLAQQDHALALPCICGREVALLFRRWNFGDPLKLNAFGIGEPEDKAELVTPDVVLVPLLAFDDTGHRLGYGGGYYDRTLATLRENGHVLAVGVGFAGQEVSALPRHGHDQRLDLVVTEQGVRRFR